MKSSSKILLFPRLVIMATFWCWWLSACSDRGGGAPEPTPSAVQPVSRAPSRLTPPPVILGRLRTVPVTEQVVQELVTAPGEVKADLKRVAKVTSRIQGQVEAVHVQLGDRVKAGQPLVAVGSLQLDQLVQEFLVAKAETVVAADNLTRTQRLFEQKIVPERAVVEARGVYLSAKATSQHIQEKLLNMGFTDAEIHDMEHKAHATLHRYTIKAPLSGTVVAQEVVLGQGVSPGDELFEVVDTRQVWVFANLPIEQAGAFAEGHQGTIIPKRGDPFQAPLAYISPVADPITRTVRVRFDVPNPTGRLKPQEYVNVRMMLDGVPTLAVPVSSLTLINNLRGVFVQRGDGFLFLPLKLGREGVDWVEVLNGLQAGDRVVTEGVFDLKSLLLQDMIQAE